jgi:hypothetical protein
MQRRHIRRFPGAAFAGLLAMRRPTVVDIGGNSLGRLEIDLTQSKETVAQRC